MDYPMHLHNLIAIVLVVSPYKRSDLLELNEKHIHVGDYRGGECAA